MDDIEQEILEVEQPEAEIVEEQPVSLRDQIVKSQSEVKEKIERERDEEGKFAKTTNLAKLPKKAKETKIAAEAQEQPVEKLKATTPQITEKTPPEADIAAPQGLNAGIKAKWKELPAEVRQEFSRREQEFHKELTRHDEERNFGRQIDKIIMPYMAQIKLEGATAPQAIENLLNMAHVLRVGSPQQKSDLLLKTAQTFGVDLRQAVQQAQQPVNPMLQGLQQQVQSLQQKIDQDAAFKKQQEDESIQGQIKTFSSDPKNVHFEIVKAHMASLLSSGLAKDLQDAYDQAVYANPHTRSTLLEQQNKSAQEKRVAEQKARADAARRAGSSIKGSPGSGATKNGKIEHKDLGSAIRAAFAEHRGEA